MGDKYIDKVNIEQLCSGMYRVSTEHEGVTLSSQDMRDLFNWCLCYARQLELEAQQTDKKHRQDDGSELPPDGWSDDVSVRGY